MLHFRTKLAGLGNGITRTVGILIPICLILLKSGQVVLYIHSAELLEPSLHYKYQSNYELYQAV
jgi:hypothetical protein